MAPSSPELLCVLHGVPSRPPCGSTSLNTPHTWGEGYGAGVFPYKEALLPPDTLSVRGEPPVPTALVLLATTCPREGHAAWLPPLTPASYGMARLPSASHFCQVSFLDLKSMSLERASVTGLLGSLEDWL